MAAISRPDVVITDYEMPGMNGAEVARAMKALNPDLPVILFSGSNVLSPRNLRAVDAFCDKAGSRDELSSTIFRMLRKKPGRSLQPPPLARASDEGRRTVA
jgi:CheY-like chemotaxis protein